MSIFLITSFSQEKKVMTFKDVMKFKKIKEYKLSDRGNFFYYTANPDRGDAELFVKNLADKNEFLINRGTKGKFSPDEKWFAAFVKPEFSKLLKDKKKKLKKGFTLLNTSTGDTINQKLVKNFDFSEDSKWIAVHYYQSKKIKRPVRNFRLKT